MFCGAAVKLIINFILIGLPEIGVYGAPIGTVISYFVMAALNFYFVAKYVHLDIKVLKSFLRPLLATGLASIFTIGVFKLVSMKSPEYLAVIFSIIVTAIVYAFLLFVLRIVKKEEILMMPKGDKICRMLGKIGLKEFR